MSLSETWPPEAAPGVRLLPVVHDRLDATAVVRAALERLRPAAVGVELPATHREAVLRAVRRLPRISLVVSEQPGEDALVWIAAPGDPFCEAMRWALEHDRPVHFVDPDLPYAERHRDAVPDPYALWTLGPERYFDAIGSAATASSEADRAREAAIAWTVARARERTREAGCLLVLLGAAHVRPVAEGLGRPQARPLARIRRERVELRHLHPDSLTAVLADPPLAHAVFELLRAGRPPEGEARLEPALARTISLTRHGLRVIAGAKDDARRERPLALARYAAHVARRPGLDGRPFPDRWRLGAVLWRVGAGSYRLQTQEEVFAWQRRLFHDFARRQAAVQGLLVPGVYEWTVAARGVADDNLAWEIFDAARTFPWQSTQAEIATARIDGDELDLGTRTIRFRRRFFRVKRRPVRIPVRERPKTDDPDEWIRAFDAGGLCSYPPEDLVVEDYGRFLQKKAVALLSAERRRVEPFSTSLLDGIDLRETIRNLHEGRIYVQELGRAPGEAGSVVVIFDRDREDRRFPFRMTWLGEHDQESDMAFYSTPPGEQIVGPGIMRATYGGFMMTYPPRRLFDVWLDPDYRAAREKAEVLLMAAIDYSERKLVVHVAKDPPSARMRAYAAAQGKRIVHIPLGSLSPAALKKIRVVHLLAGYDKRAVAREYIW